MLDKTRKSKIHIHKTMKIENTVSLKYLGIRTRLCNYNHAPNKFLVPLEIET
jgi:hypothetical protein